MTTTLDNQQLKFRTVCDECAVSKIKCNGKQPCERCGKKNVACHYRPIKNRASTKASAAPLFESSLPVVHKEHQPQACFEDHEKRTWAVFFSLYKTFHQGCARTWFHYKLFSMLDFLQMRAQHNAAASAALDRLRSWIAALGIDVKAATPLRPSAYPEFRFNSQPMVSFQATKTELVADAHNRDLPIVEINQLGHVEVNEAFSREFDCTCEDLANILSESNGGFLPWGGDIIARLTCTERDLSLYMQMVAINMEQLGRPTSVPLTRMIPSTHILNVVRKGTNAVETPCMVRAVQAEYIESEGFQCATTLVFEFSNSAPSLTQPQPAPRLASFVEDELSRKRLQPADKPDEDYTTRIDAAAKELFGDDEEWLGELLSWASSPDSDTEAHSTPSMSTPAGHDL